ncbi:MAG: hypothetical protein E4H00_08385 [Myxococcales bacterium]|nr:MAG: hypothetical protein E4H00_08385 [Myxococcales bacterium]
MSITKDDLQNRFAYHKPPNDEVALRHQSIRDACHTAARTIVIDTPQGREQALAITKLEEAMFWANAAIARKTAE